ncbi:MAG TPA: proline--tRNA ligase [Anaerolineaceae bacterium]|nr:proline--tRNA ligase [Anaerolineaceae bacterium]
MRMTKLFSQTLREAPADVESANHRLLLRAGMIRPLAAGIFSYLPIGRRAMDKIEAILREEIEAIGGQEITMPVVNPADLWKETRRWTSVGPELGRFKDRGERDMVLAMTHEEVVADLVRSEIRSYRQLPALLYHIQTKWRDDPRPRGGLVRVREFTMLDSYSLDATWEGLEAQYRAHYRAYFNIFHRCGLPVVAVQADPGMMGGQVAHEFMYLTPIGEDTLFFCDNCGYSANRQVARARRPVPQAEPLAKMEKVATPHASSIEALADFLSVQKSKTAKAVFQVAHVPGPEGEREEFIFVVVRGDTEVNETKLANAVGARDLRPATEAEIRAVGAAPGYASPVGLKNVRVVVDELVLQSPNLVAGANEEGYHLLNVNYGRDYTGEIVADVAAVEEGDPCPDCGAPLRTSRGVEVGNIFQLGTRYTEALGGTFSDENGETRPVIMGSYGIGVGRLLACIAEEHHDEHGLVWPATVAPYPVHLVRLGSKTGASEEAADRLYADLRAAGLEALYDDRLESPGIKFNDADLIGLPLRITVAERAMKQGAFEFKRRRDGEVWLVPMAEAVAAAGREIRGQLEELGKAGKSSEEQWRTVDGGW